MKYEIKIVIDFVRSIYGVTEPELQTTRNCDMVTTRANVETQLCAADFSHTWNIKRKQNIFYLWRIGNIVL